MADRNAILIVHQSSELYGSDRIVLHLLSVLKQHPKPITLHLPYDGLLVEQARSQVAKLLVAPISILRLYELKRTAWMNVGRFIKNMRFAWQQLKLHDTVILNSSVILSYMLLLPFYRQRKFIYVHEINSGLLKWGFNILLWLTGAQLICNSQATSDNYPLIANDKKHIIYNTVDIPADVQFDSTTPPLRLLMLGRISPRKGHMVLLNALSKLPEDVRNKIELRMIGGSFRNQNQFLNELQNFVTQYQLQECVSFYPFSCNPEHSYQWADCVIVPSLKPESFGLVALEAMSYGCSVIASDAGALPEIVINQQTGLIVRAESADDLMHAVQTYYDNPSYMHEHGLAGRQRAEQHFSPTLYQHEIERLIYG